MWLSLASGLFVFGLRVVDISLYTLRLLMVARSRKVLTFTFALFQSMIFVTAIRAVLSNLDKPLVVLGYSAGFATGLVVGMWLESRLAIGYTHLRIISSGRGQEITERLRREGFGVTEVACRGRNGVVDLLNCNVLRKDTELVTNLATRVDHHCFITVENVVSVRRGFWHR